MIEDVWLRQGITHTKHTYAVISFAGQGWVTGFGGTSGRHIFVHVQTYENIY